MIGSLLSTLTLVAYLQSNYREARSRSEEALALIRKSGASAATLDALWTLSWVAAAQGDIDTAERLAGQVYGPSWGQGVQGRDFWDLWGLGQLLTSVGRYAAAEQALEEMAAQCRQSGNNLYLMRCLSWLMWVKAHLGQYGQARALAEEERALADQVGIPPFALVAMGCLGSLALVEGRCAQAQQLLEETTALCQQSDSREQLVMALGVMGHAARRLGESERAWACVREALPMAVEMESFDALARAVSTIALLLTDRGEGERAAELWALLWRYPMVAHSRWYEDMAGRELAAVAAGLPAGVREAAQERGRGRDLWATARELLEELTQTDPKGLGDL